MHGMTGPERAAVLLLALGEQYGAKIWAQLDDNELRQIGVAMSALGTVAATSVEGLIVEFVKRLSGSGSVMGSYEATERLLKQFLTAERVAGIMDEIRGPAGRNMWEKLSHVQEDVLANYLKNEYPQTIAVVLSRLSTAHAGRVLAILPEEIAIDVVARMLKMDPVQKDVWTASNRRYAPSSFPICRGRAAATPTRSWPRSSTASIARPSRAS
jgi:flagellar motor switch protein FliG